jgi:hypothetical protein
MMARLVEDWHMCDDDQYCREDTCRSLYLSFWILRTIMCCSLTCSMGLEQVVVLIYFCRSLSCFLKKKLDYIADLILCVITHGIVATGAQFRIQIFLPCLSTSAFCFLMTQLFILCRCTAVVMWNIHICPHYLHLISWHSQHVCLH